MRHSKVSGGYLIYKPKGLTSRQVDNKIGRLLRTRRVGHIGTLDPLAEGLMPVLVGKATRIAPFLDSGIKGYVAEVMLGVATTTDDAEGEIIEEKPVEVTPTQVFSALKEFIGEIEQIPPRFSAKKIDGVPMYVYARKGKEVEPQPKKVTVYSIENVEIDLPRVRFSLECSTGTYVRAIARDLGNRLGCGGHLVHLVRTRVGPHTLKNAVPLEEVLESIKNGEPGKYLLSELELLPHLPRVRVDDITAWRVAHGQIIPNLGSQFKPGQLFAITDIAGQKLLAVAERIPGGYKYRRVMAQE